MPNQDKKTKIVPIKASKPNMNANHSLQGINADVSFSKERGTEGFKNGVKNTIKSVTGLGGAENKNKSISNPKESLSKKPNISMPKKGEGSGGGEGGGSSASSGEIQPVEVKLIQVTKPSVNATAVQHTSKHFDIVLGIDIHWTQIPPPPSFNIIPLPLPHPFIGIVFDPMDYIHIVIPIPKFIQNLSSSIPESIPMGGSIMVHGRHKATTTTSVMGVVIPFMHVTALIPVYRIPFSGEAPHEGEVYYGSKTVLGQGSEMSGCQPQHVLTCMGIPFGTTALPSMPDKPKKNPLAYFAFYNNFASMYVQINTGKPVLVGGEFVPHVYTLGEMAMRFAGMALMKGLSKAFGKGMKSGLKAFNHAFLKKGPLSKLKVGQALSKKLCKAGFEPVNFATGEMFFDWDDFEVLGSTSLQWKNTWYSQRPYDNGLLGNGVFNNHDLFIIPDTDSEMAGWMHPDENMAMPIPIPEVGDEKTYFRDQKIWQHRPNSQTWIISKSRDTYTYKSFINPQGYTVYKVVHIMYNDGTERSYSYQRNGNVLRSIKDLNGQYEILAVAHQDHDRIAEVYAVFDDKKELQVRYDYDEKGNLTHVWDIHKKAIVFEYDYNGYVVKRTNRNGMSYFWTYDKNGKVIHTSGLNDYQEGRLEYFEEERYTKVIYPQQNNKTEEYYYDENTLVYKQVDGEGGETWYDYTSHKELKMIGSPEGRVTGYTYDEWGNIAKFHTPDGEEYLYDYNENNKLTARFAPSGTSEKWSYDEYGRMISYTDATDVVTTYQYNDFDRQPCRSTNLEFDIITEYEYNSRGQLLLLTNTENAKQSWKYDRYGRILSFLPNKRNVTVWDRDVMGRVVELKEPGQLPLNIRYDAYDLPVYATDGKQEWLMSYTPMGSLKRQVRRNAQTFKKEEALSFSYDAYENLTNITNEKGEVYRFIRNANNEVIEEIGFDGQRKIFNRDQDGLVINSILPNGKKINYEYDLAGRLTQTHYPNGSFEAYQYNNIGLLVKADNEMSSVSFDRNALGLVTQEIQGEHTVQYIYNDLRFLTTLQSSLGANVEYEYDGLGRLQQVNAMQKQSTPWQMKLYDDRENLTQTREYTGGVESTFEYDHTGMPISQKVKVGKDTKLEKDYQWAAGSRLMQTLDKISGRKTSFDYDIYGSLAAAHYGDGTSDIKNPDSTGCLYESSRQNDRVYDKGGKLLRDKKWFYKYDDEGNLVLKSTRPINTAGIKKEDDPYDEMVHPLIKQIQLAREKEKIGIQPDISGFTPTQADNTDWQQGDWAYEWYDNGMLAKVKRADGKEVSFEYDALGRRTAKIFNGEITRFVWDGNVLLHEWKYNVKQRPQLIIDEDGNVHKNQAEPVENLITWVYENNNFTPSAKIIDNETYTIISDYLGTPTQAYNEKGEKGWERQLNIYGGIKIEKGVENFVPFRYQGQYWDAEIELCYNRFRYYDVESGGYISKDPIGLNGGMALYGYVIDTTRWIDPLGLHVWDDLGMDFDTWFDQASRADIENNMTSVTSNAGLRNGGGKHEMFPVSMAPKAKDLDYTAAELKAMSSPTADTTFTGVKDNVTGEILPDGKHHRSKASSHFHTQLMNKLENAKTKAEADKIIADMHNKHMKLDCN